MTPPCPQLPQPHARFKTPLGTPFPSVFSGQTGRFPTPPSLYYRGRPSRLLPARGPSARGANGSALRALTERWAGKPLLGRGAAAAGPPARGRMKGKLQANRGLAPRAASWGGGEGSRSLAGRLVFIFRIPAGLRGSRDNKRGGVGREDPLANPRGTVTVVNKNQGLNVPLRVAERLGRPVPGGSSERRPSLRPFSAPWFPAPFAARHARNQSGCDISVAAHCAEHLKFKKQAP